MSQLYNVSMINYIYLLTPFWSCKGNLMVYILFNLDYRHSLSTVLQYTGLQIVHTPYWHGVQISRISVKKICTGTVCIVLV